MNQNVDSFYPLAHQINCRLLIYSFASSFKVLQHCSKFVKMLSVCQTDMIRMLLGVSSGSKLFAHGTLAVISGLIIRVIIDMSFQ